MVEVVSKSYEKENAMNEQVRPTEKSGAVKAVSVADYIVERLAAEGIDYCFGVAGDYVFPICDAVDSSAKVKWIGCSNELNASYAADGYARVRGAAMLATTYGVGELSALNGVMGAKAEKSLVFHVVGMPSYQHQRVHKIAHHTLGDGVFGNFVNCPLLLHVAMQSSIRRTASSKWSGSSRKRAATISPPISRCPRITRNPRSSRLM
jgi:TPP-dependent 2-oxoacid decarboxylase